jgi:hypothetical protein
MQGAGPGLPQRARGTRAIELCPQHQPGVVQALPLPPGSRSDLRRPETAEVRDECRDRLGRRRGNPFVAVPDLHLPSLHLRQEPPRGKLQHVSMAAGAVIGGHEVVADHQ